jgi:type II secretory pathway pseudopilin PulG
MTIPSRAPRRFADERGMTIAEVVVAAAILMIGLVALISVMPLGTSVIGEANRKTTATFLAQQRMEQVKSAGLQWRLGTDPLGGAGANGTIAVAQWPDEVYGSNANYPGYRRQVRIVDCSVVSCSGMGAVSAANTLRQVTVTVAFLPLAGTGQALAAEEQVQFVTLFTRRP